MSKMMLNTDPTPNPISPVCSAIGPVYQVSDIQGMINGNRSTLDAIAARPNGSLLPTFQIE
jgi:hypothetical protein